MGANVKRFREVILPLPLTSMCALRALQHLVIQEKVPQPEFIYLDSAHEKGETLLEIIQAFQLLAVDGVLVGDDLDWPAVESDLRAFLATNPEVSGVEDESFSKIPGLNFYCEGGYWILNSSPPQWVL